MEGGRWMWGWIPPLLLLLLMIRTQAKNADSKDISSCASILSENMVELFEAITFASKIPEMYSPYMKAESYDPRKELRESLRMIEDYIDKRAETAFDAKTSLEAKNLYDYNDTLVNDSKSKHFVQYMSAKKGSDATVIYSHNHLGEKDDINETKRFEWIQNANFYMLNTSSQASAIHVPTPLYDRNPALLNGIHWSNIDTFYRSKREETRDLGFQLFCSESGFMRFFPATTWFWEDEDSKLDMFDCRNTEWYINSATCSKNVIIMLDMSGSMLGQRYEIAKQTTEAILETLSHNDYFNMMTFSKEVRFLDNCNGTAGLLQATMRNKKDLRERMDFVTPEGKAEYEIALPAAFAQLLKIANSTHEPNNPGCENIIMLITDGAPQKYEKVFNEYNKDKKVRFFSFLIGEEAIDFEQVKYMACANAGYMVHIANLADVEEKVQNYIRVMSRPVGLDAASAKQGDAMWSGVYRERLFSPRNLVLEDNDKSPNKTYAQMNKIASRKKIHIRRQEARSRMFVTTVSYPVSLDGKFMGVSAVNIPLTEISQLAAPMLIGGRSYYFMLDRNGFVMYHPQLRAMEERKDKTRTHKPNYNNMDILELEVPEDSQVRKLVLECDNDDTAKISMLFASDSLDRVYPQTNKYYTECVGKNKDFVIGLAISENDHYRVIKKQNFSFDDIDMSWFEAPSVEWKVHPHWRYCLLNDTDSEITKEQAFEKYVRQMKKLKTLPEVCTQRARLVERLLFDLKSTAQLKSLWKSNEDKMQNRQAHVVYFTSPSGMIRFHTIKLNDFSYNDITGDFTNFLGNLDTYIDKYEHFINETNRKSVDDKYYRRAIRNDGAIVFDINYMSKIWYNQETTSPFGLKENATMLYSAYKSVMLGQKPGYAILGVTGMELGYDKLVKTMAAHGCDITGDEKWCVLLDEHGYVFFSNQQMITHYADFYTEEGDRHLGKWFGKINRVAERAMELLVENKFYIKYKYLDHQAICKNEKSTTMSASRAETWLRSLVKLVLSTILRLLKRFESYTAFGFVHRLMPQAEAYTSSFHDIRESFACTKSSDFYFSNRNGSNRPKNTVISPGGKDDRPCKDTQCHVKYEAAFVEKTNLVMVWITQTQQTTNRKSSCYDEIACPKKNDIVKFEWEKEANSTTSGWQTPDEEKCVAPDPIKPGGYYRCTNRTRESEKDQACSSVAGLSIFFSLLTAARWLL